MAPKEATSFDAIIKAQRQKRSNQSLADSILGKGRRSSAPGAGTPTGPKKIGGSLASRVGIQKRSSSTANLNATTSRPAPPPISRSATSTPRPQKPATNNNRNARKELLGHITGSSASPAANRRANAKTGISIRGSAGPVVVVGKNFAPGTTAADIESALTPVAGEMTNCEIVSTNPVIVVEMSIIKKEGAEAVIKHFHNKIADGRVLSLQYKQTELTTSSTPAVSNQTSFSGNGNTDYAMEVDTPSTAMDNVNSRRSAGRQAEPDLQDGSYGFEDPNPPPAVAEPEPIPSIIDVDPSAGSSSSTSAGRRNNNNNNNQNYNNTSNNYRPSGDNYNRRNDSRGYNGGGAGGPRGPGRYGGNSYRPDNRFDNGDVFMVDRNPGRYGGGRGGRGGGGFR